MHQRCLPTPDGLDRLYTSSFPAVPQAPELQARFDRLPFVDSGDALLLSLGTNGTGTPFHFHTEAWIELIRGSKTWWLFPPDSAVAFNHMESHAAWVDTHALKDHPQVRHASGGGAGGGQTVPLPKLKCAETRDLAKLRAGVPLPTARGRCGVRPRWLVCAQLLLLAGVGPATFRRLYTT